MESSSFSKINLRLNRNFMNRSLLGQFVKIAHRGASAYEPENTIRSFRRAIEMKAELIEFDVRRSKDGHLVIIHDKSVDRTTNGKGLVKDKTLDELKSLDAGQGERIPTFEEVIQFAKGKTKFVVELKESGTEEMIIQLIKEHSLSEDVFIVSFHDNLLKRVGELEPALRIGLISFLPFFTISAGKKCSAKAVAPFHYFVTKGMVEKAHQNGMYLFTWTVNDTEEAKKLRDMGVDGIVTNKPDVI